MSHLRDLERADCLKRISHGTVGRVALSTPDGPHIVPVGYAVVDDEIAVRTSAYSTLGTHAQDTVVAFQVDSVDEASRSGWSVVVRGRCRVETDPEAVARVRGALGESWVSGARTLYLRLPLEHVSGRVLGGSDAAVRSPGSQG